MRPLKRRGGQSARGSVPIADIRARAPRMSKGAFWFIVAAWYLLLAGVVAAGISRFGGDYIVRFFVEPSLKTALLVSLALLPVPFVLRRIMRA